MTWGIKTSVATLGKDVMCCRTKKQHNSVLLCREYGRVRCMSSVTTVDWPSHLFREKKLTSNLFLIFRHFSSLVFFSCFSHFVVVVAFLLLLVVRLVRFLLQLYYRTYTAVVQQTRVEDVLLSPRQAPLAVRIYYCTPNTNNNHARMACKPTHTTRHSTI